ncbi:hypothetical protein GE107_26015 [Cohnella sp. CFH 77786]|uniref:hypothetical protein n=1 Tax=Cohnella sp. CFH 77786 TaxID=2662265 RepID=UPI001C60CC6B|nr:hypothetical protein [Cohnella sp. CFH 77786]MBW5449469.1 hypothetical protein [Cohnella sp. CFH 77786]
MKILLFFITLLSFLSGCKTEDELIMFETKEKAIQNFVEEQSIKGKILEFDLGDVENILLVQQMTDVYYLGEVIKTKEKYSVTRTSSGVDIGNTTGAMWEFKTNKGTTYTIKISKENEDNESIYNKDLGLYISIVKGHRTYEDSRLINILKASEITRIQ